MRHMDFTTLMLGVVILIAVGATSKRTRRTIPYICEHDNILTCLAGVSGVLNFRYVWLNDHISISKGLCCFQAAYAEIILLLSDSTSTCWTRTTG